jgi:hypothetical protein
VPSAAGIADVFCAPKSRHHRMSGLRSDFGKRRRSRQRGSIWFAPFLFPECASPVPGVARPLKQHDEILKDH